MMINPAHWPGGLAYFAIFLAALVEGEVVFIAAAALAGQGSLSAVGVVAAGTLGAAAGDQLPFYLLRYQVRSWLDRLPHVRHVGDRLAAAVTRRRALVSFSIRFAPGLRIAIATACAYAEVPPVIFSTFSLLGAFVWATGILFVVGWLGPAWLPRLGLQGWWTLLVPAVAVIITLRAVGWARRKARG
jgi:membrane-associated protein